MAAINWVYTLESCATDGNQSETSKISVGTAILKLADTGAAAAQTADIFESDFES